METSNPTGETATCPRCGGRGDVVCMECQGTGETRNVFWVVTGRCMVCATKRGFVTCPKCLGAGQC
ncbi:MAG: hypothetical protein FJ020_08115 [Chloroflexi bacterium]|nr:hypothetical protein [Chloroflexota bacterium]